MNKERLLQLADVVEASKTFDMGFAFYGLWNEFADVQKQHPCGTAACILGHAEVMRLGRPAKASDYQPGGFPWHESQDFLELTGKQCRELFTPMSLVYRTLDELDCQGQDEQPVDFEYTQITPDHAAATIRRLVETGEVKW